MNRVTRRGVFETNSSSTHSITIAGGQDFAPDRIPLDRDGVCRIYGGEFGWEERTYHDAATKASYAAVYAHGGEYYSDGPRDPERLEMLREVIATEVGAPVEFDMSTGYIDHQSDRGEGDACGPAFESRIALRAFIFNRDSTLVTDNDNH